MLHVKHNRQNRKILHVSTTPALDVVNDNQQIVNDGKQEVPHDWCKGALLNVRNLGDIGYAVTLYPEEFDVRHPERALKFPNPCACQDFISNWYARESADPRAK